MLVLSRRPNEKIVLPDVGATIEVVSVKGHTVRLGIDAPRDLLVLREEVAGMTSAADADVAVADGADSRANGEQRPSILRLSLQLYRQLEAGQRAAAEATLRQIESAIGNELIET